MPRITVTGMRVPASVPLGTSRKPEARVPGAAVMVPTTKFPEASVRLAISCPDALPAYRSHSKQTSITACLFVIALSQPGRLWLPPLERGILRRGGAIFASRAQDSALIGVEIAIAVIAGAGEQNVVAHPAVRARRRGSVFHLVSFA